VEKRYVSLNLIARHVTAEFLLANKSIFILVQNFIDSEFHVLAVTDTSQLLVMGGLIFNIRGRKFALRDSDGSRRVFIFTTTNKSPILSRALSRAVFLRDVLLARIG